MAVVKNRKFRVITLVIPMIAFIQNPSFVGNKVMSRIGPDFFGWYAASDFFSKNEKLSNFSSRIQMELGASDLSQVFNIEKYPEKSVYTLSNFNDQITAEFLLGAQRTGLTALIGTIEKISNFGTVRLMHSLAIATSAITLLLIMNSFKKTSFTTMFFFCFLYLFNANTLSVFMEGGYGQFLATPILTLILITYLKERNENHTKIVFALFIIFCLSTYADLLIIVSLYVAVLISTKLTVKNLTFKTSIANIWSYKKTLIYATLLSLPNLDVIPKIINERAKGGTSGGWDQGNLPFYSDYIGITRWLSPNGIDNPIRGFGQIFLTIAISLLLIYVTLANRNDQIRYHGITLLLIYSIQVIFVYKINSLKINNYILWKTSAYASLLLLILYLYALSKNNSEPIIKHDVHKFMHITLFIVALTTTLNWFTNFKTTANVFEATQNKRVGEILKNYDIEVVGFPGSSGLRFVLFGDVTYFQQTRGFGLKSNRAHPAKPLAKIYFDKKISNISTQSKQLNFEKVGEKLIYRNTEFEVWLSYDKN
jgi:hypothetical protein